MTLSQNFNILEHIDRLEPADRNNRYICPVCYGNNLTIDPKTGKYQCWSGCQCSDIREAISPWDEVVANRNKNKHFNLPKKTPQPTYKAHITRTNTLWPNCPRHTAPYPY